MQVLIRRGQRGSDRQRPWHGPEVPTLTSLQAQRVASRRYLRPSCCFRLLQAFPPPAEAAMPEISLPDYSFTPQIGWSNTRSETFRSCKRRYFYQYYARFAVDVPQAHLQRLRALSTAAMTIGLAVHDILATLLRRLLRSSAPIDRQRLAAFSEQTITSLLSNSELMETYYQQQPAPEPTALLAIVCQCLDRFLASERYQRLVAALRTDPAFLIEPPGYGESRLREMKIYAKVDCLFITDNTTVIIDWKTGRQDHAKHLRQLLGYAAWAEHNLQVSPERIVCVASYFQPAYAEIEKRPTAEEISALAREVEAELAQMQRFCADPDRNIPLTIDAFAQTENLQVCRHCAFRELCDRVDPVHVSLP